MVPAANAEMGDAGQDEVHPTASQVAASQVMASQVEASQGAAFSPTPVGGTGSPGTPDFPLVSMAAAAVIVRVVVGGADHSATSSTSATPRACSFLSGGLEYEVPREVAEPLSVQMRQ